MSQTIQIRAPQDLAKVHDVSRETIARLEVYADLLRQWQKIKNLVSPGTLDVLWERHMADSLQLLTLAPHARTWLDLGSGAGFPGMVIAIAMTDPAFAGAPDLSSGGDKAIEPRPGDPPTPTPPRRGEGKKESGTVEQRMIHMAQPEGLKPKSHPIVHLVESNARKCAFLAEVARKTRAPVEIHGDRIELLVEKRRIESVEVVTARALAPLAKLLEFAHPFLSPGSRCLFLKGRDVDREIEEARGHWQFDVRLVPSQTDPLGRIAVIDAVSPIEKE